MCIVKHFHFFQQDKTVHKEEQSLLTHDKTELAKGGASVVEGDAYPKTTPNLPGNITNAPDDRKDVKQSRETEQTIHLIDAPGLHVISSTAHGHSRFQGNSRNVAGSMESGYIKSEVVQGIGEHLNRRDTKEHEGTKGLVSNGCGASPTTDFKDRNLRDFSTVMPLDSGLTSKMSQRDDGDQSREDLEGKVHRDQNRSSDACKVFVSNISFSVSRDKRGSTVESHYKEHRYDNVLL